MPHTTLLKSNSELGQQMLMHLGGTSPPSPTSPGSISWIVWQAANDSKKLSHWALVPKQNRVSILGPYLLESNNKVDLSYMFTKGPPSLYYSDGMHPPGGRCLQLPLLISKVTKLASWHCRICVWLIISCVMVTQPSYSSCVFCLSVSTAAATFSRLL